MHNYSRTVTLYCPICGSANFETNDDGTIVCSICNTSFTKEGLIEQNQDLINENVEEVKQETLKDIEKELTKEFKKFRRIKWKL